jgi:type VI protein secretion system component Hcp
MRVFSSLALLSLVALCFLCASPVLAHETSPPETVVLMRFDGLDSSNGVDYEGFEKGGWMRVNWNGINITRDSMGIRSTGAAGVAKPVVSSISVDKELDKMVPNRMKAALLGTTFRAITFSFFHDCCGDVDGDGAGDMDIISDENHEGGSHDHLHVHMTITISPAVISNWSLSRNAEREHLTFTYQKIEMSYFMPEGDDGTPGSETRAGWDLGKNKVV